MSGSVGMADEQDSGSCVVYHVWVQVPSSALKKKDSDEKSFESFFVSEAGVSFEPRVQGLHYDSIRVKLRPTGHREPLSLVAQCSAEDGVKYFLMNTENNGKM